jgi:adenine-specific DNA-methyltransferase
MTESIRLDHQQRLDDERTSAERNKDGQFATPSLLSIDILKVVKHLFPKNLPVRFLEPCVGTGSFYSAFRTAFKSFDAALGIEKDIRFAEAAKELWGKTGLEVKTGDFTRLSPPKEKFTVLTTNPPYVRHHHLDSSDKEFLKSLVISTTGLSPSGLSGLYTYFMLAAHAWLAPDAVSSWLVPSEFLDVNYGVTVKQYLTKHVELVRIHRFRSTDVQFTDALVSSCVVIFRNKAPSADTVQFTEGGKVSEPEQVFEISRDRLRPGDKWGKLFAGNEAEAGPTVRFGDLFAIKRGLATGNNGFFILTAAKVKELQIPARFLRPILPPPRLLNQDVITAREDGTPDLDKAGLLLDCPLPPEEIQEKYPKLWDYLESGRRTDIDKGYLVSHRKRWYSQEERPPAPFLLTYMGRTKVNGDGPFRFIWNQSNATAHNVYLMLYPKGLLKDTLEREPKVAAKVFKALSQLHTAMVADGARVYGGGLHKVEPKELANISADTIVKALGIGFSNAFPLFEAS